MHKYLTQFGLGVKTGIDIFGERNGLVPSKEWKKNTFQRKNSSYILLGILIPKIPIPFSIISATSLDI